MERKRIVRPGNLLLPEEWDQAKDGMTQSLFKTWMSCPRKLVISLNQYKAKSTQIKTSFGALGHHILDLAYSEKKPPTDGMINDFIDDFAEKEKDRVKALGIQEFENLAAKALATMSAYFEYYKKDFSDYKWLYTEEVFREKFSGITMRGKTDGKFEVKKSKDRYLFESKFYSQINEDNLLNQLSIDFQSFYYHLADSIKHGEYTKGILYNVIRNTGKKPLKVEKLPEYVKRIRAEILKNPDYFFIRFNVTITKKRALAFQKELEGLITQFEYEKENMLLNRMNYSSCLTGVYACPFLKACGANNMKDFEIKKGSLYSELAESGKE